MKPQIAEDRSWEFYFPKLDTHLLVENADGAVVVHASRNTFSNARKSVFIRELAAEGFIPDSFAWHSVAERDSFMGVRWEKDISWLKLYPQNSAKARWFMVWLLFGATALWLAMIECLIIFS